LDNSCLTELLKVAGYLEVVFAGSPHMREIWLF